VKVILLGPQRRPTVDAVARSLALTGPIATITAGWQEREPDDAELSTLLGGRTANLSLYRRWLDVQDRDPQYAAAERALAGMLAELQDLYLLRLDYALQAVYAVQRRSAGEAGAADELRAGEFRDGALAAAVATVRELDAAHLHRVDGVRGEFFQRLRPHDVVLLPHARARMLLDDTPRMAVFARRFAPARCVLLDSGTRIELDGDDGYHIGWPPGVRVIAEDGRVISLEAA
jgi:hypothetical protein